jgi:hypothetical protein
MKKILFLILLAALVWGYGYYLGPKTYPPGILVKSDPVQVMIDSPMDPIKKGDFVLKPLARYTISARILHTKRYWSGEIAGLAPYDIAVGWGPMSDQGVIDKLSISQGNRFYFWEYQNPPPIPQDQIICHSANMHLIPSSFRVRHTIAWLRPGDLVRMKGLLIEATNPKWEGRKPWRSSLSRTDTGNGSCEIMWVESIDKF